MAALVVADQIIPHAARLLWAKVIAAGIKHHGRQTTPLVAVVAQVNKAKMFLAALALEARAETGSSRV